VRAVLLPETLPYYPSECATEDEFYSIWKDALFAACGTRFDALFTSEDYGGVTARWLGCRHVCVDRARSAVPVSGTAVRGDLWKHWDFLDPVVRARFVKTVCVYGPESTGKTTLCERLARHYGTVWQPEYARWWLGERHCEYEDMVPIAEGQLREREGYKRAANRVLFVDTDAVTTRIYSRHYYGRCPSRVEEIIRSAEGRNDFYLLADIDLPWVADTSRDLGEPAVRRKMMRDFEAGLEEMGVPWARVTGTGEARVENAVAAVERFLRG
jgi:NadR type nicotinamide-nucleotide adenylyltransferase